MNPVYSKDIRYALNKPDIQDFNKEQLISYIRQTAYDTDYPEIRPFLQRRQWQDHVYGNQD